MQFKNPNFKTKKKKKNSCEIQGNMKWLDQMQFKDPNFKTKKKKKQKIHVRFREI